MGLIYRAVNNLDGKCYVGKTTLTLDKRKTKHLKQTKDLKIKTHFHRALRKYGWDNFTWEIIFEEYNISNEMLNEKEKFYIKFYKSNNENIGYNETDGGDGGYISYERNEQDREKRKSNQKNGIKAWWVRRKADPNYANLLSDRPQKTHCPQGHPYEGDNLLIYKRKNGKIIRVCKTCKNERSRKKIKKEKVVRTHCSKGHLLEGHNVIIEKRKQKEYKKCRTCKNEYDRNNRKKVKKVKRDVHGENNPMYGKNQTQETKNQIRETKLLNGDSVGSKNPMFGKSVNDVWAEKYTEEEILIKKEQRRLKLVETKTKNGTLKNTPESKEKMRQIKKEWWAKKKLKQLELQNNIK